MIRIQIGLSHEGCYPELWLVFQNQKRTKTTIYTFFKKINSTVTHAQEMT